jgi:hypothetical protein
LRMSPIMNRINLFPPNQASKTPIPTFHNHYPKPIVQFQYNQSINNTSIIIKVFLLWIWIWRKEETLMNPSTEKSTHYDPFGFAEGKERMKIEGWSAMTQQRFCVHINYANIIWMIESKICCGRTYYDPKQFTNWN